MAAPELHLFVLWEKARRAEARILADLAREMPIIWQGEMTFRGDAAAAYEAFYGAQQSVNGTRWLVNGARKAKKCGSGPFRVVIVRDDDPHYGPRLVHADRYYVANERMYDLKARYRKWAGRRYRIHSTTDRDEFARDVWLLTGHTAEEWARGVPEGIALNIPAQARWSLALEGPGADLGLTDCRVMLEGKYINDVFYTGRFKGRPCVVKCSSKCPWSIENEYRVASRLFARAPQVVAEALAVHDAPAFVVTAREGPSLTTLLAQGLSADQADAFAGDIRDLAHALRETGVLHRDLFSDNLLLGADGHLKAIDWQLAIDRHAYREDPWVAKNWKFRYVVFGVNRELGLGVWNDFHALGKILAQFPQTGRVRAVASELAALAPEMAFSAPPQGLDRLRLWLYGWSLRLQMLLRGRRHRKYAQLARRWRTVRGTFKEEAGAPMPQDRPDLRSAAHDAADVDPSRWKRYTVGRLDVR